MASRTLEVAILAKDRASVVFEKIGSSAKTAGQSLDRLGKDGEQGFRRVGEAADKAEREVREVGQSAQKSSVDFNGLGLALTGVGTALALAGDRAMDQERQIIALRSAYGDAADEMLRFAEELDSVTIFTDDDIRAGERFFATLRNNYGFTIEQIKEVARITADLASASGVTYEDAANRVTAALRGEAEAAEYLGLTMNQQAIDRDNLTLSMSNQEAALFRLNALRGQSSVYEGAAADLLDSNIGRYAELTDTIDDAAAAVGGFIGPFGSMVGGIGLGISGVTQMAGGFGSLGTAAKAATAALGGAAAAVSSWSIALAGGALTGAAIGGFMGEFVNSLRDGEGATKAFSDATNILSAALNNLKSGDVVGFFRTLLYGIEDTTDAMKVFNETASDILTEVARQQVLGNDENAESLQNLVESAIRADAIAELRLKNAEWLHKQTAIQVEATGQTWEQSEQAVRDSMTLTDAEMRVRAEAMDIIAKAYLDPATNAAELDRQIAALDAQLAAGTITLDEHTDGMVDLARQYGDMPNDINDTADAIRGMNNVAEASGGILRGLTDDVVAYDKALAEAQERSAKHDEDYLQQQQSRWEEERSNRQAAREEERAEREAALAEQERRETQHNQTMLDTQQTYWDATRAQQQAARDEQKADHDARLAQAQEFIATMREVAGIDSPLATLSMTSLSTDAMGFARNIQIGNDALANTFRIVVENTNAMGQTVQATEDWINELVGAQGEWGKIDDLLASGAINQTEYNAAIAAQGDILTANAAVQEDILAIQAKQAPLMAELTEQQAAYIDALSGQSAEQQLVALGWMDSTTAAQAYTIVTQAASVATGEMGASGRAAFEGMVEGAIAANPPIEALLTNIGLVSRDHEGNLIFHYDGMEQANSEIKMLTESILMLVDILDDGELNGSVSIDTLEAQQRVQDLAADLGLLDGQEANISVNGDGSAAKNVMGDVANQLLGLDGQTATTYQEGVPDGALGAISTVAQDLAGLDGDSATVYINAVNNAGAAIGSVAAQLFALDGQSATVTTNYVSTYSSVGVGPTAQHGGIPSYATGGVVVHAAEGDRPEIAHFAGGGTALLPRDGLYNLPPMTYISPNNSSTSYGSSIVIDFSGAQFNNTSRDEMNDWAANDLMPAMVRAVQRQRVASGLA